MGYDPNLSFTLLNLRLQGIFKFEVRVMSYYVLISQRA